LCEVSLVCQDVWGVGFSPSRLVAPSLLLVLAARNCAPGRPRGRGELKLGLGVPLPAGAAASLMLAQPTQAQLSDDRQEVATALISQAISERVGRKVDLSSNSKPVRDGPSKRSIRWEGY
jgi:hypothetical protein